MTVPGFDVVILGGGPGGYVAAIRGAQLGLRVALVEREAVGGVCLNWGCIPAKALLRGAEVVTLLREAAEFGVDADLRDVTLGANVDRSRRIVGQIVSGVESLLERHGVTVLRDSGRLLDARTVATSTESLQARNVIVATGARPRALPDVLFDGVRILDSRAALALRETPKSVLIVGGGCVGVEFACLWRAYGARVTIVEHDAHLLGEMDADLARRLEERFREAGIEVYSDARAEAIAASPQGVTAEIVRTDGTRAVAAERALVAVGIAPNSAGLGLEGAGVGVDARGFVTVDERCQTSATGVFAIGDVTGLMPLAHVASAQGVLAVETIAGLDPPPLDYDWMPRAVYSDPQVARIGLTEAESQERGRDVVVGRIPYATNGKAAVLGRTSGLAKLVADAGTGEILGFHAIGEGATELLAEVGVAHALESTIAEVASVTHAHPSLSEVVREAALAAAGRAVNFYQ